MIEVVNDNYTFKKVNDVYILSNVDFVLTLTYSLYRQKCDEENELIFTGSLLAGVNKNFENLSDGEYTLNISVVDVDTIIYFNTYIYLRKQFITLIKDLLCCDCGCDGLNNTLFISKDCKTAMEFQAEYGYILNYFYALKPLSNTTQQNNNPYLPLILEALFNNSKCDLNKELCKQYFNNALEGFNVNSNLNKYQLALIYLSLYFYEKSLINSNKSDELVYLNKLYDFNNISKCIKKLGIDIQELEGIINDIIGEINDNINNQLTPNHASNLYVNSDSSTVSIFFKKAFSFNYQDPNNNPIKYIKFYNTSELNGTYRLRNNESIVDYTEYDISALVEGDNPVQGNTGYSSITDPAINTNYPNRLLTILTPANNEILEYGVRNAVSETYVNASITINII